MVDPIRQAIRMVRRATLAQGASLDAAGGFAAPRTSVTLEPAWLEKHRIVAHGDANAQARVYDMLRTQVLHEMDRNRWQFLAVTSATAGCGKSVTACNLALGISRLPHRSALLLDFDLHNPSIAKYLGINADTGILDVLEGNARIADALIGAEFGRHRLLVLPGDICEVGAPEWIASQAMTMLLQTVKRDFRSHVVIFDLPPMLVSDEVISILPKMDAVLLIAGAGITKPAEIQECRKYLKTTPVVRVVLNRMVDKTDPYYGHGYGYGQGKS